MADEPHTPLRLSLDGSALVENWRNLAALSGPHAACGAAIKADGYGLGACEVVTHLASAGCKDFFAANWQEAHELAPYLVGASLTVLNGILPEDMPFAIASTAKPMLNSPEQVELWRGTGLPCDIMIDSGMNRLGINLDDVPGINWDGLNIDVLSSHLASADEDVVQNSDQLAAFESVFDVVPHKRKSLANSAGIALGSDYAFDLTRPGLAIYGGIPRQQLTGLINPVATIEAQVLQVRSLNAGDKIGYNATRITDRPLRAAVIAIGYADGYLRGYSNAGIFYSNSSALPVLGRVSMDLVILDISGASDLSEGDWVQLPLDLPTLSRQSGLSQYEILTGLGQRYQRNWRN